MASYEDDLLDLANEQAEGESDLALEDELDGAEDFALEDDALGEDDLDLGISEAGWEDDADLWSEAGDFSEDEDEAYESAIAYALEADDADEFFGKLIKGLGAAAKKVGGFAKKAAPWVGKIARGAAPILSAIPHPYAQMASKVAGVLGKLKAEGASEDEALETVAELAAADPRAVPVVAGLAARTLVKRAGSAMSAGQRKQVARTVLKTAKKMVNQGGPRAIRAFAKTAKSVKNTTAARGTPPALKPKVLQRTAARVAANPALASKLSRPNPVAAQTARRALVGSRRGRSYTIPGPTKITISMV
jgi:hypothetical protein